MHRFGLSPAARRAALALALAVTGLAAAPWGRRYRPLLAGGFGLVHGAGLANYLQSLFDGPIVLPLLGFNPGIELGQLLVLAGAAGALALLDRAVPPRARTVLVSAGVVVVAARMAVERLPW